MLPIQANEQRMSSREIAELTGKRHDNVKRLISDLANQGVISYPQIEGGNKSANGVTEKLFMVNQRDSYVVVAQLSPEFTGKLVDRWQQLESDQPKIPTTLSGALRLAAEQAEKIEALTIQAKNDAPKVEFAEAVRRMEGACKIGEFSKTLGIGRNSFFAMLRMDKVLMPDNMPYQRHIDAGLLVVVEQLPYTDSKGKTHPAFTTMVTGKGQVWLERKYRQAEAA